MLHFNLWYRVRITILVVEIYDKFHKKLEEQEEDDLDIKTGVQLVEDKKETKKEEKCAC